MSFEYFQNLFSISKYIAQSQSDNNIEGQCLEDCPVSFYKNTDINECAQCHSTCYTCDGPLENNCLNCPKAQKASLKQENDNQIQTKSLNNDFEQKYTQKENQSSQLNQLNQLNLFNQEQYPQDENYTQNFLEQIMQSHIKTNSLIPTQNNRIYQNSIQNLQYEQTNQESNQLSQTKISSQYIPTIGTISNFNQANNQKVLDKQGEANSAQQQPKYKADNKFKFAIIKQISDKIDVNDNKKIAETQSLKNLPKSTKKKSIKF
ncbi:hypothetical protein ABPG73_016626 [Tetrahymena malaccensis]